ncbi:hypothetical protein BH10ACI1_BH10ACI1_07800 [soil metagenome]
MRYFCFNRWLAVALMLSMLTFGCQGKRVMSEENNLQENNSSSEVPSIPELEKYIFSEDEYTAGVVPRKLSAPEVAKVLIGKIEKNASLNVFTRVEMVARFYETFEVVEKYKQFLDKKEANSEEVRRSIVIARIIGYLGTNEDVAFVKQYYKYLISRAESVQEFEEVIRLHEVLNLGSASGELHQKLDAKTAVLAQKKETDFQAEIEYQQFRETLAQKLYRAEAVQTIKQKILGITDRKKRLAEEIKAYMSLEYGFNEYLKPWATGRIRRETWGAQPDEQIKRTDNTQLKADVANAFREFLGKLGEIDEIQPDESDSARVTLLRAIKFFDGKISDDEEYFLQQYKGKQGDVLANEGFQLS